MRVDPFLTAGGASSDARARFVPREEPDAPETKEFVACHRLAGAQLPPYRLRALLDSIGGVPSKAFALSPAEWTAEPIGLTDKQVARMIEARNADLDAKLLRRAVLSGAYAVLFRDSAYPSNLLPLNDAPPILFVRGELLAEDRFSLAIVGTRRPTKYGQDQAAVFAGKCAQHGLAIISGGAAGIDAAAHQGALDAGGRTIAVLGCGIDIAYPSENRSLFERIAESGRGAVVSEFPLGTRPEPWRFPTRNRIIAGISRACLLVETPESSGALGTAARAVEYGRDVYVIPGPVDTGRSRGGHLLIRDGAIIADSPEEMLESLGVVIAAQEAPPVKAPVPRATASDGSAKKPVAAPVPVVESDVPPVAPANLSEGEAKLLAALDLSPKHLDDAAIQAGLSAPQATVAATLLEMKSLIRRRPGNLFTRIL